MHSNVSSSTPVLVLTKSLYLCTKLSFGYLFLTFSVKNIESDTCLVKTGNFTALSPVCTAVLASSSKFQSYLYKTDKTNKKFQPDGNIFGIQNLCRGNCLPYVWHFRRFPVSQKDKYRDETK